jgi:hypothetical protein
MNDAEQIAEFIRTRGIHRCPTVHNVPGGGEVNEEDILALRVYEQDKLSKRKKKSKTPP